MRSIAIAGLAFALLVTACPLVTSAQPAPAPTPEPAPGISATPVPVAPAAEPLPAPSPSGPPSPAPTATPSVAPSGNPYKFVVTPPPPAPGQPGILEIDLLDATIHAGQPYSVRVRTTLDVTAINVSAMGSSYGMQQGAPGLYASDGTVPSGIPFFLLNRDYVVTVSAQTKDGRTTSIPITLHLAR